MWGRYKVCGKENGKYKISNLEFDEGLLYGSILQALLTKSKGKVVSQPVGFGAQGLGF